MPRWGLHRAEEDFWHVRPLAGAAPRAGALEMRGATGVGDVCGEAIRRGRRPLWSPHPDGSPRNRQYADVLIDGRGLAVTGDVRALHSACVLPDFLPNLAPPVTNRDVNDIAAVRQCASAVLKLTPREGVWGLYKCHEMSAPPYH